MVRLWLDDVRPAPKGFIHAYTVDELIEAVKLVEHMAASNTIIEVISLDNDLGEGLKEGYKFLDWMEATGRSYPIHIHSANTVAVERMRQIIQHNNWEEVRSC